MNIFLRGMFFKEFVMIWLMYGLEFGGKSYFLDIVILDGRLKKFKG